MNGRYQFIGIVEFSNLKLMKETEYYYQISQVKVCFIYTKHIIFMILNPKKKLDIKSMKGDDLKHF